MLHELKLLTHDMAMNSMEDILKMHATFHHRLENNIGMLQSDFVSYKSAYTYVPVTII